MYLPVQFIVIILALICHEHKVIAQTSDPYLVFRINKHTDTVKPVYSVQVMNSDGDWGSSPMSVDLNYLLDIDAPLTWHDCYAFWQTHPVSNDSDLCRDMQRHSYKNSSCHPSKEYLPDLGYWSCPVVMVNPLTRSCVGTQLNIDNFIMSITDGRNVLGDLTYFRSQIFHTQIRGGCANSSPFDSFPQGVTGVMALSTMPYALPYALCLPSDSSTPGVLFYGTGPYYLLPQSNVDIRSLLSYTPLLKYPDTVGHFISVNAIIVKKRSIDIPVNATTKLSTIEPYTTLRTDIYTSLVRRFIKVTRRIPRAKPIAPFGLCYSTFTNGTKVGLKVPNIDLRLQGGTTWTVSSPNSIKQMTTDVACLAFVDGGVKSKPAISIGTFQFENNLVVFDSENSTFGFSSSLLSRKTSCANFNFTVLVEY